MRIRAEMAAGCVITGHVSVANVPLAAGDADHVRKALASALAETPGAPPWATFRGLVRAAPLLPRPGDCDRASGRDRGGRSAAILRVRLSSARVESIASKEFSR